MSRGEGPVLGVVSHGLPPGTSGYLMDHPRVAYLFDPQGKPIELLPVDSSAEAVMAELRKWVS